MTMARPGAQMSVSLPGLVRNRFSDLIDGMRSDAIPRDFADSGHAGRFTADRSPGERHGT